MKILSAGLVVGALIAASPAFAHDTETSFATRGACERASAAMSNEETEWLVTLPDFFSSTGEVASFLTRAWTCDRNASDGQWYITDHVEDALASDWYLRRND
jgi:hypothetical protein